MTKLLSLLEQLESYIADYEKVNLSISKSSVGWHLEHSFLVLYAVSNNLKKSNPSDYKWKFNFNRFLVQTILKKIPRGRGKAPKSVQPVEEITSESLKNKLEKVRNSLAELESLDAKNHFTHPYFGNLNLKNTIHFLELHTKHHLKIIEDILKT